MSGRAWAPDGPGTIRCAVCGQSVSTNALARRAHERSHESDGARYGMTAMWEIRPDMRPVWRYRTVDDGEEET